MSFEDDSFFLSEINLISPIQSPEKIVYISKDWSDPEAKFNEIEKEDKLNSLVKEIEIEAETSKNELKLESEDYKLKTLNDKIYQNFKKNHPSQNCSKTIHVPDYLGSNKNDKQICKTILRKGLNRGKRCTGVAAKGSDLCHAHKIKSPHKHTQPNVQMLVSQESNFETRLKNMESKVEQIDKKLNFLLKKDMNRCIKPKLSENKPKKQNSIKLSKLNKKRTYILQAYRSRKIAVLKTENGKEVNVKIPAQFYNSQNQSSTIKYNSETKQFVWV